MILVDEASVRESLFDVEDPEMKISVIDLGLIYDCLLYTSPSPRD